MEIVNNVEQQQQVASKTHTSAVHGIADGSSSSTEKVAHTSPHLVNTRENSAQRIRYFIIIIIINTTIIITIILTIIIITVIIIVIFIIIIINIIIILIIC